MEQQSHLTVRQCGDRSGLERRHVLRQAPDSLAGAGRGSDQAIGVYLGNLGPATGREAVGRPGHPPRAAWIARVYNSVVADEGEGEKLRSPDPLQSLGEAKAMHLGRVTHAAGQEHTIAHAGNRSLERLDEAIQGLLRRAARHRYYGTVTRRKKGSIRCNSMTSSCMSGLSS